MVICYYPLGVTKVHILFVLPGRSLLLSLGVLKVYEEDESIRVGIFDMHFLPDY